MIDHDAAAPATPPGMHTAAIAAQMPDSALGAMAEAHRRNVEAVLAAHRTVVAGCQDVYARMIESFVAGIAEGRDRIEAMRGRSLDATGAARTVADAEAAFRRGIAEFRGMSDLARDATADAFAILRARAEEAMAEMRREIADTPPPARAA